MTVIVEAAPPNAIEIVRQNAPMLLDDVALALNPEIGDAWPVHVMTILSFIGGGAANANRPAAWRYPIFNGTTLFGVAEVSAEPIEWAALHPPAFLGPVTNAIQFAMAHTPEDEAEYRLRLFSVPAASFHAVWLHGPTEIFVPINFAPPLDSDKMTFMQATEVVETTHAMYTEQQLLDYVRPRFERRKAGAR